MTTTETSIEIGCLYQSLIEDNLNHKTVSANDTTHTLQVVCLNHGFVLCSAAVAIGIPFIVALPSSSVAPLRYFLEEIEIHVNSLVVVVVLRNKPLPQDEEKTEGTNIKKTIMSNRRIGRPQ